MEGVLVLEGGRLLRAEAARAHREQVRGAGRAGRAQPRLTECVALSEVFGARHHHHHQEDGLPPPVVLSVWQQEKG